MSTQSLKRYALHPAMIAGYILLGGILMSAALVFADTATTSVTVTNATPAITNVSFNSDTDITLTENTFVNATVTMSISDSNGCSEISSVNATVYLASTTNDGTTCTYDGEDCYTETAVGCMATSTDTCAGGSDTTVDYECGFKVWYVAQPTDASGWTSSIWSASATTTDGTDTVSATNTGETVEVNTLLAHDVTATIAYGSVAPGSNTGTTNSTTTVTNTGNAALDTDLSGDHLCDDYPTCSDGTTPDVIATTSQEYALVPFDFASAGTDITGSAVTVQTILVKPTATTSAITDLISWGIEIAAATPADDYTGQNTFTAVAD